MTSEIIEYISWIFVGIALIGSIYNSRLNQEKAFKLWFISNLFFVLFNLYFGHYGAASLYSCHWFLTINGLKNLREKIQFDQTNT